MKLKNSRKGKMTIHGDEERNRLTRSFLLVDWKRDYELSNLVPLHLLLFNTFHRPTIYAHVDVVVHRVCSIQRVYIETIL